MDVKDKVVVISGASSGIGKELAIQLFKKGAKLALLARREDKLKQLHQNEFNHSPQVILVKTDVSKRDEVKAAVQKIAQVFGRIDIVINNAGVGYFGSFDNIAIEDFDRIVQTNIYGVLHLSQETIPHLKMTNGIITNVSSGLSKRALPYLTVYAASKSMLDSLSDGMRLELKPYGIKVINYCPPETETEIFENTVHEPGMESNTSHRRKQRVEDVVRRMVLAIEKEQREVVEVKSLDIMNFFAPKLLDKIFYKAMVVKEKK